ncbi:hypothetical protein RhiirA4_551369 [Rhizophagus irregularis]|uniref:Uncharacterized protein n=1 Tax=Rhizophagus irregularis TaxID=588596 RepID=A0A2I1HVU7_9GLOM|nr:hypothetical protein RhiirA4_551369 [Rhizophagus irregularis]
MGICQNLLQYRSTYDHRGIYSTSRIKYQILLTENAFKDDTELCKNVKRVLKVIVGLLKDRALGSEEPARLQLRSTV